MLPQVVIDRLRAESGGRVILSGPSGKDSLLLGLLLGEAGFTIECFYRADVLGVPCLERPTEQWVQLLRKRFPGQVGALHKFLGKDAFRMVSQGCLRWHVQGRRPQVAPDVTREEVEDAARRATGFAWVADGIRVDEMMVSYHAQTMRAAGGFFPDKRKCSPLWALRRADVRQLLALRGIDEDALTVIGGVRSHMGTCGFALLDTHMAWLQQICRCPVSCVERVLEVYPGARFLLERYSLYGPEAYLTRHQPLLPFRLR